MSRSPPRPKVNQPKSLLGTIKARRGRSKGDSPKNINYDRYDEGARHHAPNMFNAEMRADPYGYTNYEDPDEEEVYIVKQRYGYLSIAFSVVQVLVLAAMMIQCGVAPLTLNGQVLNPMIGPYPDALSYWGGKNAYLILEEGENWRLVTPIFLHAGVLHLLGNVAIQLDAGAFFEREWGSWIWLLLYLTSAIGSSMLSCIVMPDYVSVGSSGAVCGIFGAKLSEIFCRMCESTDTSEGRVAYEVRKEQFSGVFCSLVIVGLFSFVPFVDWGAHLGGMITGIAVGIMVFSCSIYTAIWRILWFAVGTALTIAGFVKAASYMYGGELEPAEELKDVCGYYKQWFEEYECNCQKQD